MINFQNVAAASQASGFQYYDSQPFSMSVPGRALAAFSGSLSQYSQTVSIPKNRLGIALTSQILSSVLVNMNNVVPAGQYWLLNGSAANNVTVGSAGGFPIFYRYSLSSNADANNVNITLNIANPSGVNAVTPPTIAVSGKVFLYLAPF